MGRSMAASRERSRRRRVRSRGSRLLVRRLRPPQPRALLVRSPRPFETSAVQQSSLARCPLHHFETELFILRVRRLQIARRPIIPSSFPIPRIPTLPRNHPLQPPPSTHLHPSPRPAPLVPNRLVVPPRPRNRNTTPIPPPIFPTYFESLPPLPPLQHRSAKHLAFVNPPRPPPPVQSSPSNPSSNRPLKLDLRATNLTWTDCSLEIT